MKKIFAIAFKDARERFSGFTEWLFFLILPIVFTLVLAGGTGASSDNRIRLVVHPDNAASRRLAEKCGFRHEGTARGAWYHKGKHQDVEIYALLHDDVITP